MGLGIRGWRRVGLGTCKVGGVGSRSNHAPWVVFSSSFAKQNMLILGFKATMFFHTTTSNCNAN